MPIDEAKYRKRVTEGVVETPLASPALATEPSPAMENIRAAAVLDGYTAFKALPHPVFMVLFKPNSANERAPVALPYSLVQQINTDGDGFAIAIHFSAPTMCVMLQGRNLNELLDCLMLHKIELVQEYDARKWPMPAEGMPCITGMEISYKSVPVKEGTALQDAIEEPAQHSTH